MCMCTYTYTSVCVCVCVCVCASTCNYQTNGGVPEILPLDLLMFDGEEMVKKW